MTTVGNSLGVCIHPGKISNFEIQNDRKKRVCLLAIYNLATIGQYNTSKMCSVGDVPDILYGNVKHNSCPFDGVVMGVGR